MRTLTRPSPPRSDQYVFHDLGGGVTFGEARPEGTALSNTGIVDLGEATLVFDTSLTLGTAREIRAASKSLTGRFPALAANSHWHLDHVLGNQIFADGPIYATRRTAEILVETRAALEKEIGPESLEAEIRDFETKLRAAKSDEDRAALAVVLRINRAILAEVVEIRLTAPSATFESELALPGPKDARLVTFGAGHTESDALLHLPKLGIVFAGDLVVSKRHPNLASGDPEHWLEVLDRIDGLRPERVGVGHGPLGSAETVAEMRDYLRTVLEFARATTPPEIPHRFRAWPEPDRFAANVEIARRLIGAQRPGPGS